MGFGRGIRGWLRVGWMSGGVVGSVPETHAEQWYVDPKVLINRHFRQLWYSVVWSHLCLSTRSILT